MLSPSLIPDFGQLRLRKGSERRVSSFFSFCRREPMSGYSKRHLFAGKALGKEGRGRGEFAA